MVGVLFDTNIYGFIIKEPKEMLAKLTKSIIDDRTFIIHNFKVIRDELRKAPNILPLYDSLVTNNIISVSDLIEKIAKEYYDEYKRLGGMRSKNNNFMNDLKIVACASIKNFNLIYSEDKNSMWNSFSMQVYKNINLKYNLRTPSFYNYYELKKKYGVF